MKIYTKKGDRGKTYLADGTHHAKTEEVFWAMGEIDVLNCWIGLCISKLLSVPLVIPTPPLVIPAKAGILNSKIPDRASLVRNDKIRNIRVNPLEIRINQLQRIQENLFSINSILAQAKNIKLNINKETKSLENNIDQMEKKLPELKNFILPGGHELSAIFQIARAKCRRTERQMVSYQKFIPYINRLSDYFFVLARFVNFKMGGEEKIWKN